MGNSRYRMDPRAADRVWLAPGILALVAGTLAACAGPTGVPSEASPPTDERFADLARPPSRTRFSFNGEEDRKSVV